MADTEGKTVVVEPAKGKPAKGETRGVVSDAATSDAIPGRPSDGSNHQVYDAVMTEAGPTGAVVVVNGTTYRYPFATAVDIPEEHLRILADAGYKVAAS